MFPLLWGHIFNNLQLRLGFNYLRWQNSNSGCRPHNLHLSTNTSYAIISLCRSNQHPWKWACQDRRSVDHPWKWDSSADIKVSLEVVLLLFCLCRCCFSTTIFVDNLLTFSNASVVLILHETVPFNALVSSDAAFITSVLGMTCGFVMY